MEPCLFLKVARPRKATQIHQENSERCLRRLNHSLKNLGPPSGSGTAAWLMHALEHVRYPKADETWFVWPATWGQSDAPRQRHWKAGKKIRCVGRNAFLPPQTLVGSISLPTPPPPQHLLPCYITPLRSTYRLLPIPFHRDNCHIYQNLSIC